MSDYYNNFVVNTSLPDKLIKQTGLLDNAQYLMFSILEHLNVLGAGSKVIHLNQTLVKKHGNLLYEGLGIRIGSYSGMFGRIDFYLSGVPIIYNSKGEMVDSSKEFKKYIENKKMGELCFEHKAYIKPVNSQNEDKYYGVFNSLQDAIKIVQDNEFVKIGEVTS